MCDMDGVLVHEGQLVPGADAFLNALRDRGRAFLILTNNSIYTARDLPARLVGSVSTSPERPSGPRPMATAAFLKSSAPAARPTCMGEAGLTTALHEVGLRPHRPPPGLRGARRDPDLQLRGDHQGDPADRATAPGSSPPTPTPPGPSPEGALPAYRFGRGADHKATGVAPYFVGKPNPLMMREALNSLGAHSEIDGDGR